MPQHRNFPILRHILLSSALLTLRKVCLTSVFFSLLRHIFPLSTHSAIPIAPSATQSKVSRSPQHTQLTKSAQTPASFTSPRPKRLKHPATHSPLPQSVQASTRPHHFRKYFLSLVFILCMALSVDFSSLPRTAETSFIDIPVMYRSRT